MWKGMKLYLQFVQLLEQRQIVQIQIRRKLLRIESVILLSFLPEFDVVDFDMKKWENNWLIINYQLIIENYQNLLANYWKLLTNY